MNHEWKRDGKPRNLGGGMSQCYQCGIIRQVLSEYGTRRTQYLTSDKRILGKHNPGCGSTMQSTEPRMSWHERLMLEEADGG